MNLSAQVDKKRLDVRLKGSLVRPEMVTLRAHRLSGEHKIFREHAGQVIVSSRILNNRECRK